MQSPHDNLEIMPTCTVCGSTKQPRGRSAPMGARYCHPEECVGYDQEPIPSSYWAFDEPHLVTGEVVSMTKHAAKSIDINDLPAGIRYAADQLLDKWAEDNGVERP